MLSDEVSTKRNKSEMKFLPNSKCLTKFFLPFFGDIIFLIPDKYSVKLSLLQGFIIGLHNKLLSDL